MESNEGSQSPADLEGLASVTPSAPNAEHGVLRLPDPRGYLSSGVNIHVQSQFLPLSSASRSFLL
jgi:hypothetical protein